jgi:hypothetical protein
MKCPKCGIENEANWPITVNNEIEWGGCQDCWEAESDAAWWNAVDSLIAYCEDD